MAARKVQQKKTQTKKHEEESGSEESKSEGESNSAEESEDTASSNTEEELEASSSAGESEENSNSTSASNKEEENGSESEDNPNENPRDKRTTFIKGISTNVTEDDLRELFGKYGEIKEIRIPKPKEMRFGGEARGIAYIEFAKKKACRDSFELDGTEYEGKNITVNLAKSSFDRDSQRAPREPGQGAPRGASSKTLFLGNLPFEIDNEEFLAFLREHAKVKDVRIPTNREDGRPRGFGFAEFDSQEDAEALLAAKLSYHGRDIRVQVSEVGKTRDGRGEGFGGRGGREDGFGGRGGNERKPHYPKRSFSENSHNAKQTRRIEFE